MTQPRCPRGQNRHPAVLLFPSAAPQPPPPLHPSPAGCWLPSRPWSSPRRTGPGPEPQGPRRSEPAAEDGVTLAAFVLLRSPPPCHEQPPASPCLTSWMRKVMAGVEEVLGTPLSPRCCSEDGWVRGAESRSSASGSAHGKPLPRKCEGCRDRPQHVHAIPSLCSPRASPPLPHTVPVTSWGRRCCPDAGRCPEVAPRLLLGLCCSLSEGKGRSQPRRRTGGDIGGAQGQDHDSHPEGTGWERVI